MNKSVAYVALAVGVISIVYLLSIEEVRLFGVACRVIGEQTVRGPFGPMSEPVCLDNGIYFTGMAIGIFLVLFAAAFILKDILFPAAFVAGTPSILQSQSANSPKSLASPRQPASAPRAIASPLANPAWKTLKEVDPDIQEAVAKVIIYGRKYEEELAERYLALGDKTYLNSIVERVLQIKDEFELGRSLKEKEFSVFKETPEYEKQFQDLSWANVFETFTGIAFVLSDYRCVQVENSGDIKVYSDINEREKYHKKDVKWTPVIGEEKRALINRFGEDIIKSIFLKSMALN